MGMVRECIEVAVPVRTAFDQWTQFESFPRFLARVRAVDVTRPSLTRWAVRLGPVNHEFLAEIVEQQPDSHVRWRSLDRRLAHRGDVHFEEVGPSRCRVTVTMTLDAPPLLRRLSERVLRGWVRTALDHFAAYIEGLGDAGVSWRGAIRDGRVEDVVEEPPAYPGWPHG
ncbi:SRPBCC family protein [Nocardioides alcanivorans]|uniref:SRPBCC family protein n=1 Tax=Nocardioides alcanivorans TaxID=2897352 RepID=UPI001F4452F5|nr:SRPBCC family protein [Nocardioides alcanivorans]